MSELNKDKIIEALDLANHPHSSFSFTGKDSTKVAGETHYNFHGKSVSLDEPYEGAIENKSTTNYTIIVKNDTGNVFVKVTTTDAKGHEIKGETNKTVGTFGSVADFNKALDKATEPEIVDGQKFPASPGTVLEALHNIEFAKTSGHNIPTGKGETPEVEAGAKR